jgi:hypothetical protein
MSSKELSFSLTRFDVGITATRSNRVSVEDSNLKERLTVNLPRNIAECCENGGN